MNTRILISKTLPVLAATAFLAGALGFFTLKYAVSGVTLPPVFEYTDSINRMFFLVNFYFPFAVSALCLYACLYSAGFFIRICCLIAGLTAAVISCYVLNDLLTINLCIYSAYVTICAIAFNPPRNYYITAFTLVFFTVFFFFPVFLGPVREDIRFVVPIYREFILLSLYLVILGGSFICIRSLLEKFLNSEATVSHLNAVSTKLLLFNHRLQEFVRNSGEEAVKKDRLRFTSDLHDSCGYVFTNIIAVADAAMSFPSMKPEEAWDTFHLIRNQSQQGLNRTREILHMIRELEEPLSGSIDTLFEMKSIFQEVTGIQVDIEYGNMKHDYGATVNMVLTRIVQEAFTNSIRHGQATRILIHFWEFPESLTMTVTDNGIGAQQVVKGIGLAGMEERLAAVGGTLELSSPEDGGFRLRIFIPLKDTA